MQQRNTPLRPSLRAALSRWAAMTGRNLRDLDLSVLDHKRRAEAEWIITELEGETERRDDDRTRY